ncbi:MAG: hypothetical protein RIC52_14455, partial [Amphiplicatus sp.]
MAATVILMRDGPCSIELFMVARHHQIEFASGALVFPGGSVDEADFDERFAALGVNQGELSSEARALRVAAAREAFEECGVLLARENGGGGTVSAARARTLGAAYRAALTKGDISFADILEREGLKLHLDQLAHFAHWVTPAHMPKRFDTHFFLAAAPVDQLLKHDGEESVDSVWITPRKVCEEADAARRTVLLPTRLNVERVARSPTVDFALRSAYSTPVCTIRPEIEKRADGRMLRIPPNAGYGGGEFLLDGKPGQAAKILKIDDTDYDSWQNSA